MEAPTMLDGALERIKQMMEEIDRKEAEIKRLKTSSAGKIKVLNKYNEENEKRIKREGLKEEVKRKILRNQEEKEDTRKRIWREEREMRHFYTSTAMIKKRYRHDDD